MVAGRGHSIVVWPVAMPAAFWLDGLDKERQECRYRKHEQAY
jgi:hypothetical protein